MMMRGLWWRGWLVGVLESREFYWSSCLLGVASWSVWLEEGEEGCMLRGSGLYTILEFIYTMLHIRLNCNSQPSILILISKT
jgi:hypothetical protein